MANSIGASYRVDVARSAQRWDLKSPAWEGVAQLKDGKFSREAMDAVGVRGKLCMVSMKGNVAKEGVVYDVGGDRWEDMPAGLLAGWTGPTTAMDEKVICMADESRRALREYDVEGDGWKEVIRSSEELKGVTRMAAEGGRVCAVVIRGHRDCDAECDYEARQDLGGASAAVHGGGFCSCAAHDEQSRSVEEEED